MRNKMRKRYGAAALAVGVLAALGLAIVLLARGSDAWVAGGQEGVSTTELGQQIVNGPADPASGCDENAPGMANPAAVYCQELGYEYEIVDGIQGQQGICVFPDGSECDEWRFLEGKCGESYSYCARQGYGLITKTDGKDPFSIEYSVCVEDGQEIGSVTELMGLVEKATRGSRSVEQRPSSPEEWVSAPGQPSSFDWRTHDGHDWMTSVKNQASCGGCWAFGAIGTTEAVHNIAAGNPNLDLDLSEEYLISDCYALYGQNCCGGFHTGALQFIRDKGIPDEGCLPWVSGTCNCPATGCDPSKCAYYTGDMCSNGACSDRCADWASRLETIASMGRVSPSQMKQHIVDRGPLSVVLGVESPAGAYWDGDIYRCTDDSVLNHVVVIAGYVDGSPPSGGYWIVKNSWGASWGPDGDGYFKVGYGECGIESYVYYASLVEQSHTCTSYSSSDVPKAIPDPGTVTSNLNVGDSFALADVNVGPLDISHPWDDDLDVFLISPAGTRVELFTDIGGDGDNFIDTILDDDSIVPIVCADHPANAPFSQTFVPEGALVDLNGEDSSGQWQLEITDDYGDDAGTLNSWELELCHDVIVEGADVKVVDFWTDPGPEVTAYVSQWVTITAGEVKHNNGPSPATAEAWWTIASGPEVNVRWLAQPGDECTLDGVPVPCDDPGDINDLHFEVPLPVSVTTPVFRDFEIHCKEEADFLLTLGNEEWPIGLPDPDPSNNALVTQLIVHCIEPPPTKVRIGSGQAAHCTNASVPLEVIEALPPGVAAVKVDIYYDPNVAEPVDYTEGPGWDMVQCNLTYEHDGIPPDIARCNALEGTGMVGDALIGEIVFHCVGETGECTPLHLDIVKFTDPDGNPMVVIPEDGEFCCGLLGDVNCDGEVDIVDALFVLQYDLGLRDWSTECPPPPGTLYGPAGDVTCDGDVDIVDALFILQCDLGLRSCDFVCP